MKKLSYKKAIEAAIDARYEYEEGSITMSELKERMYSIEASSGIDYNELLSESAQ
jgi:hypothetical protein